MEPHLFTLRAHADDESEEAGGMTGFNYQVRYKGFTIHPRKKVGFPLYYALVYHDAMSLAGFTVDRDDEAIESRERAVDLAKHEIDAMTEDK